MIPIEEPELLIDAILRLVNSVGTVYERRWS